MAADEERGSTVAGTEKPEAQEETRVGEWEIHIRRAPDGFTVQFKTDPARQKAVEEAVEAFREFRRKARRAGLTPIGLMRALLRERVRDALDVEDD